MFRRCLVFLISCAVAVFVRATDRPDVPASASGTFVQRKTLADLDVTLTSTGTFRFEKNRLFVWRTLKPVETVFTATPSNYTYTANGTSKTRALNLDVSSLEKVFQIKEVATLVKEIRLLPEKGLPERATVLFTNGDRLEIELKPDAR